MPVTKHPLFKYLREDRMPHIWCQGCGIGTALNSFLYAFKDSGIKQNEIAMVSGIGCTGRIAGYVNMDSFHTTHGRAIPFACGLKAASPSTTVVVFSGDGDLFSIGGNHFIHAGRKNMDILVICVNNLNYAMTGGQVSPTTPISSITATAPYGSFCPPFNLPGLAKSVGADYVARWTVYHVKELQKSIGEALKKKGFRFIEIVTQCPTLYERKNNNLSLIDKMNFYKNNTEVVKDFNTTKEANIELNKPFIVGKFVDLPPRPTYLEAMNTFYDDKFKYAKDYERYEGLRSKMGV